MSRDSKNYRDGKECPIRKEYDGFAFSYQQPATNRDGDPVGHPIFKGYSGDPITFRSCNLVNTVPPRGSILIDCNTTIVEIRKLRPDTVEGPDEEHEDVIHGRTNPDTLEPEYKMEDGVKEPLRVPVKKRETEEGR